MHVHKNSFSLTQNHISTNPFQNLTKIINPYLAYDFLMGEVLGSLWHYLVEEDMREHKGDSL
jgi:hypothetical protein